MRKPGPRWLAIGVTVLAALVWGLAATQAASVPNANSVGCPKAPSGWSLGVGEGGRLVRSPNPKDATPTPHTFLPGTNQVQVSCVYFKNKNGVKVAVNYALPTTDFNPYADFYVGCTTKYLPNGSPVGDRAWTSAGRVYRVVSVTHWDYASFQDAYHLLGKSTVPAFEAIARKLLAESLPAAHNCKLPGNGKATAPPKTPIVWSVGFSAVISNSDPSAQIVASYPGSGDIVSDIVTKPDLTGSASDVTELILPDLSIHFGSGSTGANAVFHVVGNALAFDATSTTTTLEVAVQVTSSTYPACTAGSTGTLTLTTADPRVSPATVVLNACGSTNLLQPAPGDFSDFGVGIKQISS